MANRQDKQALATTGWIRSLTSLVTLFVLNSLLLISAGGCALFEETPKPPMSLSPESKVFSYSFDQVWLATQKAIQQYPMRVNNMDLKILETDYINSDRYWAPPHLDGLTTGDEYQIKIRVISGDIDGKPAHKVSVLKEIIRKKDFFSESKRIPSNGMEERAILYRIGRELVIERALERAQKKINESNQDVGF